MRRFRMRRPGSPLSGALAPHSRLSRRDRRALLVGVLSIVAMTIVSRGLPAWRAWQHDTRQQATTVIAELSRAEALLRSHRTLADSLAARGERFAGLIPEFLSGKSPAAAGATLAGLVSGAAADAGVELGSVEIRPDSLGSGELTRVSVRVNASGDVRGVMNMLATLESGPELLAIRSLKIDQPDPGASSATMERLRVTLVVEGLLLTPRMAQGS